MYCAVKTGQTTFPMRVNILQHFVPHLQTFSFPLLTVFKSFLVIVFKLYYEYHSFSIESWYYSYILKCNLMIPK